MLVSLNMRQQAYAPEAGHFPICLITVNHSTLTEPIRISTDPTERIAEYTTDTEVVYGTYSRGNTFLFLPVRLKLPDDQDEGPGDMTLELDNVHGTYVETIRSITSPPTVSVEMVMSNALDTVDAQWPLFKLTNVSYDASTITGTVKFPTLDTEPEPSGTFTPGAFPGLA